MASLPKPSGLATKAKMDRQQGTLPFQCYACYYNYLKQLSFFFTGNPSVMSPAWMETSLDPTTSKTLSCLWQIFRLSQDTWLGFLPDSASMIASLLVRSCRLKTWNTWNSGSFFFIRVNFSHFTWLTRILRQLTHCLSSPEGGGKRPSHLSWYLTIVGSGLCGNWICNYNNAVSV